MVPAHEPTRRREPRPARPKRPEAPEGGHALLDLQRRAGNRAVTHWLQRTVTDAPPEGGTAMPSEPTETDLSTGTTTGAAHPLLRRGTSGSDVLELQSKLNLVGATPALSVDGVFGPKTQAALRAFQTGNALSPDAIVGPLTWAALDAAAIGPTPAPPTVGGTPGAPPPTGKVGARNTGVGATDTGVGKPDAPAIGSIHPVLGPGASGPAVEELQFKLQAFVILNGVTLPTPSTGQYDVATTALVFALKASQNVSDPTVQFSQVGPQTWAALDAIQPASPVGRVEKRWEETVAGDRPGMTSRYTWRIQPDKLLVEVNLQFTGDLTFAPALITDIKMTWNRYAAEHTDDTNVPHEQLPIVFEPKAVASGGDNSVALLHSPDPSKPSRSDASHWFVDDSNRLSYLAAHEFGHMIGLEDEYQRGHQDFLRTVGELPDGTPLADTATPTEQVRRALFLPPDSTPVPIIGPIIDLFRTPTEVRAIELRRVVENWGVRANRLAAFQVAQTYSLSVGRDLVADIKAQLPANRQLEFINVFTFTSGSVMGVPDSMNADADGTAHAHPVEPRHLRSFADLVATFKGGTWLAKQVS